MNLHSIVVRKDSFGCFILIFLKKGSNVGCNSNKL